VHKGYMFEVFIISLIYWSSLLMIFIWLNRRLAHLKEKISDLEREEREKEGETENK
jgi:predicted permease